jgi:hypothetical protein
MAGCCCCCDAASTRESFAGESLDGSAGGEGVFSFGDGGGEGELVLGRFDIGGSDGVGLLQSSTSLRSWAQRTRLCQASLAYAAKPNLNL